MTYTTFQAPEFGIDWTSPRAWHTKRVNRKHPRRSCLAENGLPKIKMTPDEAARAVEHTLANPRQGTPAEMYRCPCCGMWHVGRRGRIRSGS